jgi:hypothetical protein
MPRTIPPVLDRVWIVESGVWNKGMILTLSLYNNIKAPLCPECLRDGRRFFV